MEELVKVVHCKDCKYFKQFSQFGGDCEKWVVHPSKMYRFVYDYCSYGKPKEGLPMTNNALKPCEYKEPRERIITKNILFEALAILMDIDRDKFDDIVSFDGIDYFDEGKENAQLSVVIKMNEGWDK